MCDVDGVGRNEGVKVGRWVVSGRSFVGWIATSVVYELERGG